VKLISPDAGIKEQLYQPLDQVESSISRPSPDDIWGNFGDIVVRSTLPPEQMENSLRATVRSLDPQLPLAKMQTMEEVVSNSQGSRRFHTALVSSFALAAVFLALLGIYSVIAYSAAARTREMAIRIALGSQRSKIMGLVLLSGAKLTLLGCAAGLLGAIAISGVLRSFLFSVTPFDPTVLLVALASVFLLAMLATAIPGLRVLSIRPMMLLRSE
jgi:ABC-type antimicrobial peptide transport system permease subunit